METDTVQRDFSRAVIDAVRQVAREQVMPRFLNSAHRRKADGSLCTDADLAAQEALIEALDRIAPLPVLAEEMPAAEQSAAFTQGDRGLWCVDPIDGTSNFVHGLPHFAISVALLCGGRPILGVVHDPCAGETFHASVGAGAYLDGAPLPLRRQPVSLRQAMAGVDFKRLPRELATRLVARPPYASQRNYGAGTLDWCYLAAGRTDVYLHGGQKVWDYAAGALILAEAGGSLCTLAQEDFWAGDPWQRSAVAAGDPGLFREWRDWLATGG